MKSKILIFVFINACLLLTGCLSEEKSKTVINSSSVNSETESVSNKLLFGKNILYFQDNRGQLFQITKDAKPFDCDINNNFVVYVSKYNGKLYLYNHINRSIRTLNSPEKYYVRKPKFYNEEIFYTVADNQDIDPYPSWLYATNINKGLVRQITDFSVNLSYVKFYKGLFVLPVYDSNAGIILVNPDTKQYIKISDEFPINFDYEINDDKLYFMNKNRQRIIVDLNNWVKQDYLIASNTYTNNDNIFYFQENYNVLYSQSHILYFRDDKGVLFEITRDASASDYAVSDNVVVYVSRKDGKLYLYDYLDKKIKPLNSPKEYFCKKPKLYKNYVFYTVMYGMGDAQPAYLFVTDIRNGVTKEVIHSYIDMYSLLEYKNLYIFKGFEEAKLVLLNPDTHKYVYMPINNNMLNECIIKASKLVSVDDTGKEIEIVDDLDYWVNELEKL
jgi:hypothetical protein